MNELIATITDLTKRMLDSERGIINMSEIIATLTDLMEGIIYSERGYTLEEFIEYCIEPEECEKEILALQAALKIRETIRKENESNG